MAVTGMKTMFSPRNEKGVAEFLVAAGAVARTDIECVATFLNDTHYLFGE